MFKEQMQILSMDGTGPTDASQVGMWISIGPEAIWFTHESQAVWHPILATQSGDERSCKKFDTIVGPSFIASSSSCLHLPNKSYESNSRNAQYKVRNRPMCLWCGLEPITKYKVGGLKFQFRLRSLSWGLLLEPHHKHWWPVPDLVLSVSWIAKLDSYGLVC